MNAKADFLNEESLLKLLQVGDKQAYVWVVKRYGGNAAIAAYGWCKDVELATKLVRAMFIKLQDQRYKNAVLPLGKYLVDEVKAECTLLLGLL